VPGLVARVEHRRLVVFDEQFVGHGSGEERFSKPAFGETPPASLQVAGAGLVPATKQGSWDARSVWSNTSLRGVNHSCRGRQIVAAHIAANWIRPANPSIPDLCCRRQFVASVSLGAARPQRPKGFASHQTSQDNASGRRPGGLLRWTVCVQEPRNAAIYLLNVGEKNKIMGPLKRADRVLGRYILRFWAILAFLGAAASTFVGLVVLFKGHFPGLLMILLGAFFLWTGLRAWKDRATLGDVLNRDFERCPINDKKSRNKPKQLS